MSHLARKQYISTHETPSHRQWQMSYLLPIHSNRPVDNKLPGLPCTAGKEGPEDRNIQPPLQGSKRHLSVGSELGLDRLPASLLEPRASTSRNLRSIICRQVGRVHRDDTANAAREHALPLTLTDLFAMVGAGEGLGCPFLLEECAIGSGWAAESLQVIQIVLAP